MLDDFEFSYKFSRSIYTKLHDFYVCLLVCHFFSFLCTFKPVSMVNRALTVMVKDRKCFCSYMYQKQSQIVNDFWASNCYSQETNFRLPISFTFSNAV